jgi:membrane-bound lytic murein transglycosylase D
MFKSLLLALAFTATSLTAAIADDIEVESRLETMNCLIPVSNDPTVIKRIQTMLRAKKDTEKLIGRTTSYFPIFDQYLKDLQLPADLKYITCLETELNNKTVSSAGARGIWQLMTDVKEEFGLRVDAVVDERLDLYRGTEAALKDFKRMYKAYEDWRMTLAGYNCGVGRLGQAIKRAKSRDFDKVKKFLPQQTQEYIPKFVAFSYIMKNYRSHDLTPSLPKLDMQSLGQVKVYNYLSLTTVANITGLPYESITELNPQYAEGYVPESTAGYSVVLPRRVMGAVQDYLANPDAQQQGNMNFAPMAIDDDLPKLEHEPDYFVSSYVVGENETIEAMADLFNISTYSIMYWNNLSSMKVEKGQELKLYMPRVVPKKV